jgi:hypothetical protein
MSEPTQPRPKNVIVLDADNPMVEVRGEFYWREDHEQILLHARHQAFKNGFAEGYACAQSTSRPATVVLRRRRPVARLLARLMIIWLVAAFVVPLVLTALQAIAHRH